MPRVIHEIPPGETVSHGSLGACKPKILVWGINYAPEETGIAPYNTDTCAFLRERDCRVSMLTAFPYYPHWRKRPQDRWRLFRSENDRGVRLYRCGLYVPARPTAFRRILHEGSFAVTSFFAALFLPRPDAILVVTPPLLLGVAARLLSVVKGAPYFVHVQDMQPDAAIQMGFLRPGVLTRVLYRLERIAYRGAVQVSGITGGMIRLFREKGIPAGRTALFPNWDIPAEPSAPLNEEAAIDFRHRNGIAKEAFLVAYSGNLGRKQGLSILVDAAQILRRTVPHVHVVIAGDGGEKPILEERVRKEALPNVQLLPLLPTADYHALLRETDLCVVTQQKGSGALFFPSKLLRILAAAKAVIAVADENSELDLAVREGGVGLCVPPELPQALAAAIKELAQDPARLGAMAARGPVWMRQFDRQKVLNEFHRRLIARLGLAPKTQGDGASVNSLNLTPCPLKTDGPTR